MSGNHALAEGAIMAGCRFFAGYPITPSTEIAELIAEKMPKVGGIFLQMEDEIASIMAVIGASWAGVKAMTATSGPGFSLMQESIGLAVMLETPCVIVNVQRGGPATGTPTLPAQGDVMQAKWGSHGSYEIIAISPNSPQEAFWHGVKSFNLAERYRVPVIILMDECVGHMYEKVVIPRKEDVEIVNRKVPKIKEGYLPFKPDEDLVPPMAAAGMGFRFHVTSLTHDERGYPSTDYRMQNVLVKRLNEKIKRDAEKLWKVERFYLDDADIAVISFGITSRPSLGAVRVARKEGIRAGLLRLVTIWPFPEGILRELSRRVRAFVVAEMNYGQIFYEVQRCAGGKEVILAENLGGRAHTTGEILEKIRMVRK